MRKHLAVALKNPESIQELFGANDDNLAVFEELLGIRIYLQGNQIYIDAASDSSRSQLEELLAQLQEHLRLGNAPNPDLIRAVHSSLETGRTESVDILKDTMVVVPNGLGKTFARSHNQALYLQAIERHDLVFGIGPAGTGKTYLAVALALKAVLGRSRRKLILTRPVVEAGENLGFLPGDLEQKISPYLRPLYDAMESLVPVETIRRMEENRTLEIAPLAYMRGRTLLGLLHHSGRGPEHHEGTDEDVPHPDRRGLQGRGHRRHHPDRPAQAPELRAAERHPGAGEHPRDRVRLPGGGGRGAPPPGAQDRARLPGP